MRNDLCHVIKLLRAYNKCTVCELGAWAGRTAFALERRVTRGQERRILARAFRWVDGASTCYFPPWTPVLFLLNKDAGLDRSSLRTLSSLSENIWF